MNHFHQTKILRRVQRTKSLLITESAAIRIDYNLEKGVLLYPYDARTMRLTQPAKVE